MQEKFTFIDLFAGIGGMRIAFEKSGGRCVFSSEWNKFSQQTYEANFGDVPDGDITKIKAGDIPNHDILVGGFPCQPFSIAGVSSKKALGRKHGFEDETQGTLFFDIVRIIREKKPRAFLLENVKNLKSHDKGNTFRVIMKKLREELGYDVHYKIVDASSVVPQHRERIFIVGFRKPMDFEFPKLADKRPKLKTSWKRRWTASTPLPTERGRRCRGTRRMHGKRETASGTAWRTWTALQKPSAPDTTRTARRF